MPEQSNKKRFYSTRELIDMGYASRSTLNRRILSGEVPAVRDGHRYLIPVDEFEAMLERNRIGRVEGVDGQ